MIRSVLIKRQALATIVGAAVVIFIFDQITKFLVVQYLPLHHWWSISPEIGRLVRFTFITNTGAALGMFPQLGSVFMVIAIVVILGILLFHHQLPVENVWVRLALGLQLGGALGNLADRLSRGYVVDFVDIGFWPIFNMADVAIVIGVLMLAYCYETPSETSDFTTLPKRGNV